MDTKNLWLINKGLGLGKPLKSKVAKVSSLVVSPKKLKDGGAHHNSLSKKEPFS
jgi:hypothetical protein